MEGAESGWQGGGFQGTLGGPPSSCKEGKLFSALTVDLSYTFHSRSEICGSGQETHTYSLLRQFLFMLTLLTGSRAGYIYLKLHSVPEVYVDGL